MDKFMFWKKKKNPADSAAQHLANLMGTSVAGFTPEPPNDKVDLNTELFIRNNVAIAGLVIITALVKGTPNQQARILNSVEPAHLGEKSLESYLFMIMADKLRNNREISLREVEQRILEHSQAVYGESANKESLEGDFYKWSQILSFEPSDEHIAAAIEKCQNSAKRSRRASET